MNKNAEIIKMYSEGEPIADIAQSHGLNYFACYQIIRRARLQGLIQKRTFKKKSDNYKCPKTDKVKLFNLYANGEPLSDIAKELNISVPTIRHHIRQAIKKQTIAPRKRSRPIDQVQLFEMYQNGDPLPKIAQSLSVSVPTIRFNIEVSINKQLINRRKKTKKTKPSETQTINTGNKNMLELNPAARLLLFIQSLASSDMVSKEDMKDKLSIRDSSFYRYLAEVRQLFPIEFVGNIGGNSYYQIDKKAIAKFFNIKIKPE